MAVLEKEITEVIPEESYTEDELLRAACLGSFEAFVRYFWDRVPGAAALKWNWHMGVLCRELQEQAGRVILGLPKDHDTVFNVPPGTSKSTICSILFPAYLWARAPWLRILSASHTADLVMDLATKARSVILSDDYRRLFPWVELTGDQDTKTYYRNTAGGDRYTCTVAGKSPMGFHAHVHLVDDPIDPKKARSQVELIEARHFMTEVLPSRKVDKAVTPCILIMQRLGIGDPTDVLTETGNKEGAVPVRKFVLPAELTDDVCPKELAACYADGLLDPGRLSAQVLKQERANMPAHAYSSQYLQKPTPPGGSMFKGQWFNNRVRAAAYKARRVFAIDRASTHDGGCYTACVLLARADDGRCYVEDVIHGQWEPDERNEKILQAALKYRARYGPNQEPTILIEAEGGSSGVDAFRGLARKLAGFRVRQVHVTGSKDVRAEPWADYCASGNVLVVDGGESQSQGRCDWDVNGFVKEHENFRPEPGKRLGGFKDRVDACSLGFNWLYRQRTTGDSLPLKRIDFGVRKGGPPVRLVVIPDPEELARTAFDQPGVLVACVDPAPKGEPDPALPGHAISRLSASVLLPFIDMDADDVQQAWGTVLPGLGRKPEEVILTRELGRKLWGTVLKRHELPPKVIVFSGESPSDARPMSVAMAVCDALHYKRDEAFLLLEGEADNSYKGEPPNKHVYEQARSARGSVAA